MKVLVTGHHGYIGSVLAPMVRDAGHEVVGLDTFFYRGCDFGSSDELQPSLSTDLRDVTPADLAGFDAIVHLAALSNDPLGDLNSDWTYDINGAGTISLARAAKDAGVPRFVFASSCSMYGASGGSELLDESAPLRPLTPYAESKVSAEAALPDLVGDGFAPVSMRNATVYGASPRLRLDIVLNNLVAWAHTTGAIRLQSDGTPWRPLVHVQDVARAAIELLGAPEDLVAGEAYNIGSAEQNYRIGELAEIVHRRLPHCDVTYAEGASPDPRSYRVDFGKFARTFPDFRFAWTAERGADELASAYESVGMDESELGGHRYVRLNQLKRLLDSGRLDDGLRWVSAEAPARRLAEDPGSPRLSGWPPMRTVSIAPSKPRGLPPGVKLGIEIAKNAVAALPMSRVAIDARRRRHELKAIDTNDPERSRGIFAYQEAMISRYRSISGRLLEIGPGRSLGVAALFVKAGCSEAIAIDVDPRLDATEKFYEQLDVADALERVAYVCPMPLEKATFPDGYFDLIVSHVVAEYFSDPDAGVRNIVRMLAPGGASLHQIRLLGNWKSRDPSDFLRPSERAWHLATSHRRGQPNRWRLSDWAAAFERHGAPIVETGVPRRVPITAATRERLALEFRTKSLDDLSIYNARILAIKRTA